jgi:uncharacterized protein (TIGR02588 family)
MATQVQAVHKRTRAKKSATPALEWLLGGLGAAMLFSGVAFLVHQGLTSNGHPGAIVVKMIDVSPAGDAFVVRYEMHNSGDDTLSNLRVTARLRDGEKEIESSSTIIDYLPARSTQEGGFYLRRDPRLHTLEIAPEGYQSP